MESLSPDRPAAADLQTLITNLYNHKEFDQALFDLAELQPRPTNFGLILWHSFGTVMVLIQQLMHTFNTQARLTIAESERIIRIMKLFQCIVEHPESRRGFIDAKLFLCVVPMLQLDRTTKGRRVDGWHERPTAEEEPAEAVRIHAFEVVRTLATNADSDVLMGFLEVSAVEFALDNMHYGVVFTKTLATNFYSLVLCDDYVLHKVCTQPTLFLRTQLIIQLLANEMGSTPDPDLVRQITILIHRLRDHHRGAEVFIPKWMPINFHTASYRRAVETDCDVQRMFRRIMYPGLPDRFPMPDI